MPAISLWIARQSTTSVVPPPIADFRCRAVHLRTVATHERSRVTCPGNPRGTCTQRASLAGLYDVAIADSSYSCDVTKLTPGLRRPRAVDGLGSTNQVEPSGTGSKVADGGSGQRA